MRKMEVNVAADAHHKRGLEYGLLGEFALADEAFTHALAAFDGLPTSPDQQIHAARIWWSIGFNEAQAAVAGQEGRSLDAAQRHLLKAASFTRCWVPVAPEGRRRQDFSSVWREANAQHGATLSLLARVVVAEQADLGDFEDLGWLKKANQYIIEEQRDFGRNRAHGYLRLGDSSYLLVNNAMHGARAERLNGRLLHVIPHLGRVAAALARSDDKRETCELVGRALWPRKEHEQSMKKRAIEGLRQTDLGRAVLACAHLGRDLISRKRALAATKNWKTI